MTEVVREFKTRDGLGAMLWKKIYAMSYAKYHSKLFENTTLDWFLVHESDNIKTEEDYNNLLYKFNNVLFNPWGHIDFDKIENKTLCTEVGAGAPPPGMYPGLPYFLDAGPYFNKFSDQTHNSIVIHIRRGNAIPENPRYVPESFYVNLLSDIQKLVDKLSLINPEIIICTDATNSNTVFYPKGEDQQQMWRQPHLYENSAGGYQLTTLNTELLKNVNKNIKIFSNLDTYDTFILMLTAKVLIVGNSALSQSAGILSSNYVVAMPPKKGMDPNLNYFKNKVADLDPFGYFIF